MQTKFCSLFLSSDATLWFTFNLSVRPSVQNGMGEMWFSHPLSKIDSFVKIPYTNHTVCNLLCPSVCQSYKNTNIKMREASWWKVWCFSPIDLFLILTNAFKISLSVFLCYFFCVIILFFFFFYVFKYVLNVKYLILVSQECRTVLVFFSLVYLESRTPKSTVFFFYLI